VKKRPLYLLVAALGQRLQVFPRVVFSVSYVAYRTHLIRKQGSTNLFHLGRPTRSSWRMKSRLRRFSRPGDPWASLFHKFPSHSGTSSLVGSLLPSEHAIKIWHPCGLVHYSGRCATGNPESPFDDAYVTDFPVSSCRSSPRCTPHLGSRRTPSLWVSLSLWTHSLRCVHPKEICELRYGYF
jgi:hypothetical protein